MASQDDETHEVEREDTVITEIEETSVAYNLTALVGQPMVTPSLDPIEDVSASDVEVIASERSLIRIGLVCGAFVGVIAEAVWYFAFAH